MKNFRIILLDYISVGYCDMEEIKPQTIQALKLIRKFLTQRFDNELKQYNNDETKAYDSFIAKRNLDLLRYYIEEMYLLDKEHTQENLSIRKEMRYILNNLFEVFREHSQEEKELKQIIEDFYKI